MTVHKHHRKRRSQGGEDSWGNLIELPPELHELVHREPELAYEHGLLVREGDNPHLVYPDVRGFMASVGMEGESAKKPKKNAPKGSPERRARKRISVAVPNDREDGGGLWDDMLDRVKDRLVALGAWESPDKIPAYEGLMAALQDWLNDA